MLTERNKTKHKIIVAKLLYLLVAAKRVLLKNPCENVLIHQNKKKTLNMKCI